MASTTLSDAALIITPEVARSDSMETRRVSEGCSELERPPRSRVGLLSESRSRPSDAKLKESEELAAGWGELLAQGVFPSKSGERTGRIAARPVLALDQNLTNHLRQT